jgi:hypothetical protein
MPLTELYCSGNEWPQQKRFISVHLHLNFRAGPPRGGTDIGDPFAGF